MKNNHKIQQIEENNEPNNNNNNKKLKEVTYCSCLVRVLVLSFFFCILSIINVRVGFFFLINKYKLKFKETP